jgi:hypothetical protein
LFCEPSPDGAARAAACGGTTLPDFFVSVDRQTRYNKLIWVIAALCLINVSQFALANIDNKPLYLYTLILPWIYFVPTIITRLRCHRIWLAIFVLNLSGAVTLMFSMALPREFSTFTLNLFSIWSLLAWIVALICSCLPVNRA